MDIYGQNQTAPPTSEHQLVKELSIPLFQAKTWMRMLGVLAIIGGILQAITLWGLIICWLPIWMGILIFRAASAVEIAQLNGDKAQLFASLNHLKTFFTIQGVIMLIMIVLSGIGLLIAGGSLIALLSEMRY
jgi:hypothetical protein